MTDIRPLLPGDWASVRDIYIEGLATGNTSFVTDAPEWDVWDKSHIKNCRLVATENNTILGWVALTPISNRAVYSGVAEISVYIAIAARGKGIGKTLLRVLVDESEKNNFWTLEARVFPENKASIKIHEECGFRIIGSRQRIGQMNGVWRDLLLLERRSSKVGI